MLELKIIMNFIKNIFMTQEYHFLRNRNFDSENYSMRVKYQILSNLMSKRWTWNI